MIGPAVATGTKERRFNKDVLKAPAPDEPGQAAAEKHDARHKRRGMQIGDAPNTAV